MGALWTTQVTLIWTPQHLHKTKLPCQLQIYIYIQANTFIFPLKKLASTFHNNLDVIYVQEENIRMEGFAESLREISFFFCWCPCSQDPRTDLKAEKYFCKLGYLLTFSFKVSQTVKLDFYMQSFGILSCLSIVAAHIIFKSYCCKETPQKKHSSFFKCTYTLHMHCKNLCLWLCYKFTVKKWEIILFELKHSKRICLG